MAMMGYIRKSAFLEILTLRKMFFKGRGEGALIRMRTLVRIITVIKKIYMNDYINIRRLPNINDFRQLEFYMNIYGLH